MKKYILFLVFLGILFLIVYLSNRNAPIQHTWTPTFNQNDKQPFGAFAFDKLLDKSWEKGYTHSYQSIMSLKNDGFLDNANLLIVAEGFHTYEEEIDILFDYIRKGGNALIVAGIFSGELSDTLHFFTNFDYYFDFNFNLTVEQPKDTIQFCVPELDRKLYTFPTSMVSYYFDFMPVDTVFHQNQAYNVAEMNDNKAVMLRFPMGKGNLIVSCTPLVFTNYGILNDSTNGFISQTLAYLQEKPLIRTEYYGVGSQGAEVRSPFRYLLSQKPLLWALNLVLATVVLFFIFTAKRKQKVIPVIKPPANKLLAFVNSIAALYIRKNNNADIVRKKYTYWAEELKRIYGMDIINEKHDLDFHNRFSLKTGQPVEAVKELFRELDTINEDTHVSDEKMIILITKMNIT